MKSKKSRMTDMLIDGTISKEVYGEKVIEFDRVVFESIIEMVVLLFKQKADDYIEVEL